MLTSCILSTSGLPDLKEFSFPKSKKIVIKVQNNKEIKWRQKDAR